MRTILRESNLDLLADVERLRGSLAGADVVHELTSYRDHVLRSCDDLRDHLLLNLQDLGLVEDAILTDVLSQTQRLAADVQLHNRRLASPVLRGMPADRLSLRVIGWLHAVHEKTQGIPAAVSTEEFSVWPRPPNPVIYFMPASAQQGLLYQPLFFHEFGHLLYECHRTEMDDLVRALQLEIKGLLEPLARRNDVQAHEEAQQRLAIVRVWYQWSQELFCDAVGLAIGGPAYVHAFDRYLRMSPRTEYHCQPEVLALRRHPPSWLRARLLASRVETVGCDSAANALDDVWATLATGLRVTEEYYGFYDDQFLPPIREAIDDMLVEADPYRFERCDLDMGERAADYTPVLLVNVAWRQFLQNRDEYDEWERHAVTVFCT